MPEADQTWPGALHVDRAAHGVRLARREFAAPSMRLELLNEAALVAVPGPEFGALRLRGAIWQAAHPRP